MTVKGITAEEEEKLLPFSKSSRFLPWHHSETSKGEKLICVVPALFSTDLPPCGPEVQVAYTIVNFRLRQRWFNAHGQLSVLDIAQAVKSELKDQNYLWPPFSVKGKFKRRKPWCREIVFKYQLYWIEYFVREAQAQDPELMTESELWERKKEPEVPPELGFSVERADLLKMWESWNAKKRKSTPAVPDVKMGEAVEEGVTNGDMEEADDDVKMVQKGNDSSEETIVQKPEADGLDDDASMWSRSDHD